MGIAQQRPEHSVQSWKPHTRPWIRFVALSLYYLAILIALFALYGRGNFATPDFIYQNF
jgi:hypothetical protein